MLSVTSDGCHPVCFTVYPPRVLMWWSHAICLTHSLTQSLTHTLTSFTFALSKPASSLEAGARRHLVGGPVLEAGGGHGHQFLQVNPVTFQLMDFVYFHKT